MAPPLLFSLVAWKVSGAHWGLLPTVLARSLLYFWLYIYTFCLANQLTGIEEDKTNKPHRPLVTGLVTPESARLRLLVTMALFMLVGSWLGVSAHAALWLLVIVVHNLANLARHWLVKNACMSVGIVVQLGAAWQLVTPLTAQAWRWILFPAAVILPLVSLRRSWRDMAGDARAGRCTFPQKYGERFTRRFLGSSSACFPSASTSSDAAPRGQAARVAVRYGPGAAVPAHRRPGAAAALASRRPPHLSFSHLLVLRPAGQRPARSLGRTAL